MPTLYLEQTLADQITATLPFIFRTIRGGFRGINLMTRVNVASLSVYEVRIYFWTANLSTALYLCENTWTWRERSDRLSEHSRTGTRKLHYQTFPGSQQCQETDVCVTVHHWYNSINSQLENNFINNFNQLNMFRAIISPILRSTRLYLQFVV